MRQAGEVTFADAHRPKLNEGVVEFASYSDLKNAIEKLSGKEINGRKIKLIEGSKSLTPGPGAEAVANHVQLVDLLHLKRARNVLPQVDQSLLLLWIVRDRAQGQDL